MHAHRTNRKRRGSTTPPNRPAQARDAILGTSEAIAQVLRLIDKVGPLEDPVLVQGESGTGKELVVRAIHHASPRAEGPLVMFNCAVINETLLESEMFGHEKGAFTSAVASKPGLFEIAHGGTLVIDEIGEMALSFQAKLLRVLEDYRVRRVGATEWHRINARVLVATNKDLSTQVAAKKFRDDLYYRLNVITITVPPLRQRADDVPLLVRHFLSLDPDRPQEIDLDAMRALVQYRWPGNVRELRNVIRRVQIFSDGPRITRRDLPAEILNPAPAPSSDGDSAASQAAPQTLEELERTQIVAALEAAQWNKSRAAATLGISRHRLYRLIEKYQLAS